MTEEDSTPPSEAGNAAAPLIFLRTVVGLMMDELRTAIPADGPDHEQAKDDVITDSLSALQSVYATIIKRTHASGSEQLFGPELATRWASQPWPRLTETKLWGGC